MEQLSIAEARNKFTKLVHRVEDETPVKITRRGKTVAVLMSIEDFRRLQAKRRGFFEAYEAFTAKVDLKEVGFTDEDFAGLRDGKSG